MPRQHMKETILQLGDNMLGESFESTNNIFEEFKTLSSELFFQIIDIFTALL